MSKEQERAALAALMQGKTVTKVAPQTEMSIALSASFKQIGIDKKRQDVKVKAASPKKPKRVKRNWAAQRRYDEQHGTDNGYDACIRDAQHDNEMDVD